MVSLFRVGAATLLLLACTRLASCQEDAPSPRFPWSKQDETRNLSATFGNSSHSYSVQDNWNICMRHEFILPFDEAIDDFAPLMSDLLRILNRLGGGTVRLTKGTYPVGGIIEMPSHTCILGVSSSATTIKLVADAPSFFPVNGMIHSYNGERVTVQSVALDGNHRANQGTTGINPAEITGRDGFLFQKANFVWLLNVVSRDHSGHACKLNINPSTILPAFVPTNPGLFSFPSQTTSRARRTASRTTSS